MYDAVGAVGFAVVGLVVGYEAVGSGEVDGAEAVRAHEVCGWG